MYNSLLVNDKQRLLGAFIPFDESADTCCLSCFKVHFWGTCIAKGTYSGEANFTKDYYLLVKIRYIREIRISLRVWLRRAKGWTNSNIIAKVIE